MKRKILITTLLTSTILTGCCLSHDFAEATCTTPATCQKCGVTEGELLDHKWTEGFNINSTICSECGTELEPIVIWDETESTIFEAITDGDFYSNPNELKRTDKNYDGSLEVCGSYKAGEEYYMKYRTMYNDRQYFAMENEDGTLWVVKAELFTEKASEDLIDDNTLENAAYEKLAELLGVSVEEAKKIANEGGESNGGGGSSLVATPDTDQSYATEDNFVTPEIDGNTGGNSSNNPLFNIEDGGDGGSLVTDGKLNP